VYKFKPEQAGRQATCKKCGAIVIAQPMPAGFLQPERSKLAQGAPTTRSCAPDDVGPVRTNQSDSFLHFVAEALGAFALLREPMNMLSWLGAATLLVMASLSASLSAIVPLWTLSILNISFVGLLFSFYMQTIQGAAAGDETLPLYSDWDGFVDSALAPMARFLATGIVFLPMFAWGSLRAFEVVQVTDAQDSLINASLLGLGVWLWPACALGVAVLGIGFIVRWDLIVRTSLAAPLRYLVVCAVTGLAGAVETLSDEAFQPDWLKQVFSLIGLSGEHPMLSGFSRTLVLALVSSYTMIVTARVIGLYYSRCRSRLPFDAG